MAVMQSFVVPASDHRAEGRRFRCPRVPRKDEVEADSKRAGEGCTSQSSARGPAYKPGFEPAKKAARRAVDNGNVESCTCGSSCLTAPKAAGGSGCPCRAARKDCVPGSCHLTKKGLARKSCKCRNSVHGLVLLEREKNEKGAARLASQLAAGRE